MSDEALKEALEQDLKEPREGGPGPRVPVAPRTCSLPFTPADVLAKPMSIPSAQRVYEAMAGYSVGTVVTVTADGLDIQTPTVTGVDGKEQPSIDLGYRATSPAGAYQLSDIWTAIDLLNKRIDAMAQAHEEAKPHA